jgi:hypothetical protein
MRDDCMHDATNATNDRPMKPNPAQLRSALREAARERKAGTAVAVRKAAAKT